MIWPLTVSCYSQMESYELFQSEHARVMMSTLAAAGALGLCFDEKGKFAPYLKSMLLEATSESDSSEQISLLSLAPLRGLVSAQLLQLLAACAYPVYIKGSGKKSASVAKK